MQLVTLVFTAALAIGAVALPQQTAAVAASSQACGLPLVYSNCNSAPRSWENCNKAISTSIFPKIGSDPAYTFTDEQLYRKAIYFPPTFDSSKAAVILFPGTGIPTYDTYRDTLIYLLQKDGLNPVWVNPTFSKTQFSTNDAQISSEYAAYAINYVYAINGKKNAIIGASQGTINVQWAIKYWKSTRSKLTDFIALSADFKGTQIGPLKIFLPFFPFPAAVYQQATDLDKPSKYLTAMRANGGESSIVPTTSIWSQQDTVIFPNGPNPDASEWVLSNNDIAAANFEVVGECRKFFGLYKPQGYTYSYGHIDLLVHPLTYPLIKDALTHDGPADINRITNRQALCTQDSGVDTRLPPAASTAASSINSLAGCLASSSIGIPVTAEPTVKAYATAAAF